VSNNIPNTAMCKSATCLGYIQPDKTHAKPGPQTNRIAYTEGT